jgi:hypothetical protein
LLIVRLPETELPGSRTLFEQLQDALKIARRSRSVLGLVE